MTTHAIAASRPPACACSGIVVISLKSCPGRGRQLLAKSLTPPVVGKRQHAAPLRASGGNGRAYNATNSGGSSSNINVSTGTHDAAAASSSGAPLNGGHSGGSSSSSGDDATPQAAPAPPGSPATQQLSQATAGQPSPAAQHAAPSWLSGRNIALGGSVATVVLLTIFRKEIAPLVKWLVIQTSNLTDKSVIGEWSSESIATLVAVALTLWWTFAERMKLDSLEAAIEAREAATEARVAALEQQLAAREAALEARIAELERQQAGGQAAREGAPGDALKQQQQSQGVLQAPLGSKQREQREAAPATCGSRAGL